MDDIMGLLLWLGVASLFGFGGSRMAVRRGFSEGAGFAIGFFLNILGLLIMCFIKQRAPTATAPKVNAALDEYRKKRDAGLGYRGNP